MDKISSPKRKRWVPGDRVSLHCTVQDNRTNPCDELVTVECPGGQWIMTAPKHLHSLTKKKKLDLGPLFEAFDSCMRGDTRVPNMIIEEIEKLRKHWEGGK